MRRIALRGWRHLVVLLVMLLVLSMLIRNLFAMQVLQADSTLMEHRYREEVVVAAGRQPVRGTIVDANGMTLVDTITVYKIGALPKLIAPHDRPRVAKAVAAILFPPPPTPVPRRVPPMQRGTGRCWRSSRAPYPISAWPATTARAARCATMCPRLRPTRCRVQCVP